MLNVTFWVIFKHCVQRSCCPGQANIWSFLSSIAREDLYHQKTSQTKITRNCDHWTHCKKITNYVQNFNFQTKNDKLLNQNFCWKSHDFCESLNGKITRKILNFCAKIVILLKNIIFKNCWILIFFGVKFQILIEINGSYSQIFHLKIQIYNLSFFWKLNFWT